MCSLQCIVNFVYRTFMNYAQFIVMDFFYLAFLGKTQTHLPKYI